MIHIEVRKKIVETRKNGIKIREICVAYSVGKTAVFDLLKQERETGDIPPPQTICADVSLHWMRKD